MAPAPPDKKKIFMLLGLGLVVIIVYKSVILSPPTPQSGISGTAIEVVKIPAGEATSAETEEPLPQEKLDPAGQSWGRDPFISDIAVEGKNPEPPVTTTKPPVTVTKPPENEEAALVLSGIAWSRNKAVAIINGQVVREGDLLPVQGKKIYKVITILKNRVILQGQDKTITLRVRGG